MKYTDISATFSIVTPLFEGFSSDIFTFVSGYDGLRTSMRLDRKMDGKRGGLFQTGLCGGRLGEVV
jgi:hypothetical protein